MLRRVSWMAGLVGVGIICVVGAATAQELSPEQELIEQWRAKLDGTGWTIELIGGKQPQQDMVTFENSRVVSDWLSQKGFTASKPTLTSPSDEGVAWQTRQQNDKQESAMWRGTIQGTTIRGSLGLRRRNGKVEQYTFSGQQVVTAPPVEPAVEADESAGDAAQPPAAEVSAAQPPSETPPGAAAKPAPSDPPASEQRKGWLW